MVSQQICPSCATANSTFASVCRNCATPLAPRPQPGTAAEGFAVYRSGVRPPEPPPVAAAPPPLDTFEAAPRSVAGEEGGWPADRLSPSRFQASLPDGWTGLPREPAAGTQVGESLPWGPPSAPPPQRSDGHQPAVMMPAPPPPSAAAGTRAPLAFHLDGGAGTALAAAPPAPATRAPLAFHLGVGAGTALATGSPALGPPPPPPPPALPAADGAPSPTATPAARADQGGGRGWGIRQRRHSPPAGYPPAEASPARPEAARAAARFLPAPVPALPPAPWEEEASRGRNRTGLQLFVVLLLAALVAVGVLLYLSGGLNQGLGSGTHTLSAPATLDSLAQNSSSQLQSSGAALQSEIESSDTSVHVLRQLITAFYGAIPDDGSATTPDYFLFLSSFDGPLTSADLSQFDTLLTASTVESEDGVSFHCGTPTTGPMSSLCLWIDGNVMGVVEGSATVGPAGTLAAAEEARTSAER
ncbi:MAG: hypothetical protein ACLQT7_05615 [Candidatus Dormibacteria bacterium]